MLTEDPLALREKMAGYGVRFSQLDAAYPVSLPDAPALGQTYITNSIRWAYLAGCDHIDTTDHMYKPQSLTDEQALWQSSARCARVSYKRQTVETTIEQDKERHDMLITEGHWSPLEHQAMALITPRRERNFTGWRQYRAVKDGADD